MCGILGAWFLDRPSLFEDNIFSAMHALKHRGPDDQGYEWFSSANQSCVLLVLTVSQNRGYMAQA